MKSSMQVLMEDLHLYGFEGVLSYKPEIVRRSIFWDGLPEALSRGWHIFWNFKYSRTELWSAFNNDIETSWTRISHTKTVTVIHNNSILARNPGIPLYRSASFQDNGKNLAHFKWMNPGGGFTWVGDILRGPSFGGGVLELPLGDLAKDIDLLGLSQEAKKALQVPLKR